MDRLEMLMSKYPEIEFKFDKSMPMDSGGLTVGNRILINANIPEEEQYQWLCEELGHFKTSVGDISDYRPSVNAKQEAAARNWGYRQSLTYRQLEEIRHKYAENDYEIADDLGLQVDYLHEVGFSYGLHFKHIK